MDTIGDLDGSEPGHFELKTLSCQIFLMPQPPRPARVYGSEQWAEPNSGSMLGQRERP
jgi:hypothetical protein